ncbi:uncharacterized protein LOC121729276 [Aricia agestis]|uniref:uncharacterized protein LOC121729276 n=1 Tax=Aricia agestis TaxID=91739 RepID=UPI001C20BC92|nr:uncharacterized protein LOC121729276 [Aricia agestis]
MLKTSFKTIFVLKISFFIFKDSSSALKISGQCEEECSNVYDPVCGLLVTPRKEVVKKFHNKCQLRKIQCVISSSTTEYHLSEVDGTECGIHRSRRVHDFSITGAHQACNHTCPTYCLDTYKPVCAQVWKTDSSQLYQNQYTYKPMINHCHADLFSCVLRVNVTLQPFLNKCYSNMQPVHYILSVATLRTMQFFNKTMPRRPRPQTRRSSLNWIEKKDLKDLLKMAV